MKCVITGTNGFIAGHLLKLFNNPIKCDLNHTKYNPETLLSLIDTMKIDCLFHLGAISSTTETDITKICKNNIYFSAQLLEKCISLNIPFVYSSSASVYGLGTNGFNENSITSPLNYYAISKDCFDRLVLNKIKDNPKSKIIGLRYFNVYGPGELHKKDMASPVHKFLKSARETKKINIFEGSENFLRDFIDVRDVARITKESINYPSGIYNVGTGKPRSFLDIAKIIKEITNSSITTVPFPEHLKGKYQSFTCSNNNKIKSVEIDNSRISLEDGIMNVAKFE